MKVNILGLVVILTAVLFVDTQAQRVGVKVQLRTSQDRLYKTFLRQAINKPANFAGHYVLSGPGCGTECEMYAAIDKKTGSVVWLPFTIQEWVEMAERMNEGRPIKFSVRSNRIKVLGHLVFDDGHTETDPQAWQLVGGRFVLVK